MSVRKNPYITPTYQSNLNAAWRDLISALSNGDYFHAWDCLQTFFECVAPPEVEEECRKDYDRLRSNFENAEVDGIDTFQSLSATYEACENILRLDLREFCRKVKLSLFKHKYLHKEQKATPTNAPLFEMVQPAE